MTDRGTAVAGVRGVAGRVGAVGELADGLTLRGWAVDPASRRSGPASIEVEDGVLRRLTWLAGSEAEGLAPDGVLILPGLVDLHAHFREPGNEDAETIASGSAAAARGGFTTVCLMPNTTPAADEPGVLGRVARAAAASGSPVRVLAYGAVTAGRGGETLAALGELADAGAVGFSDDGAPIGSPAIFRNALLYAGALGLPIVEHPEDRALTEGAEASEGYVATVLGLRGWPVAAEAGAVARATAVLEEVVRDVQGARLHLTHLSTAAALAHVRAAKAAGLPVTCDVTPHHLALTDEWIAGSRRWAWEALDAEAPRDPWADGALVAQPFDPSLRVNPPLRSPVDAAACAVALVDGTADAIATDHAPHTEVDKHVEFGDAANGISGIETALGLALAAVEAGRLPLDRAVEALTTGPARVLGERLPVSPGLREGDPADLVVVDRGAAWTVSPASLRSKGHNSPLLGRDLGGVVRLTIACGRVAFDGTGEGADPPETPAR